MIKTEDIINNVLQLVESGHDLMILKEVDKYGR